MSEVTRCSSCNLPERHEYQDQCVQSLRAALRESVPVSKLEELADRWREERHPWNKPFPEGVAYAESCLRALIAEAGQEARCGTCGGSQWVEYQKPDGDLSEKPCPACTGQKEEAK